MNRTTSLRTIDRRLLRDTAALLKWFACNARHYGLNPENSTLRPWIIAAADCAVEVGKNPGGLFVYLLRDIAKGNFGKLSGERYDRAKLRLRDMEPDCSPQLRQILENVFRGEVIDE